MDASSTPTISMVNGSFWSGPSGGTWATATRYTATFTHSGADEDISEIARVLDTSGARDVNGNPDLGDDSPNFVVDTIDPANHFYGPQNGNTTLTFAGGESVLVWATTQIYADGAGGYVAGSLHTCYRDTATDVITWPSTFENWTAFCFSSAGTDDQRSAQVSYLYQNMPAGTFEFGICPQLENAGGCTEAGGVLITKSKDLSL